MQYISAQKGHFLQKALLVTLVHSLFHYALTFSEYTILREETKRKRKRGDHLVSSCV